MSILLEVCAGSMASVEAAVAGGAERIELCTALPLDGLTPTVETMREVRERFPRLTVHVLVRPRAGDFVYSERELTGMQRDIEAALPYAHGFVLGALTPAGDVDVRAMRKLMAAARGKAVTFHRAFDQCRCPTLALEQIIQLACSRVLTSGQQPTAARGTALLRQLVQQARGRIIVMPGGGIGSGNASHIVAATGCSEMHGSCSAGTATTQAHEVRRIIELLSQA